jgi:SpoVK/Ycf46/Vps4 family AAA+-type ATPase
MTTTPPSDHAELFELEVGLPDARLERLARGLVGFETRYQRIQRDLRLLSDPEELRTWSESFHGQVLPLVEALQDRYPLMIFAGDVGTGKTATAEAASDRVAREMRKPAMLFKLSTRVRGSGKVGHMSTLINQAFQVITREAGKSKLAFLILDEADSLAATRDTDQSHHEDKVAVNTLIQKIDDLRRFGGRVLVFLCTNRFAALDPAVVRRASRVESFERPDGAEREELLRRDCAGLELSAAAVRELVALTGPRVGPPRPGFTYSDLRNRLLPEALGYAFPDRKLTEDDLLRAARAVVPSPSLGAPTP